MEDHWICSICETRCEGNICPVCGAVRTSNERERLRREAEERARRATEVEREWQEIERRAEEEPKTGNKAALLVLVSAVLIMLFIWFAIAKPAATSSRSATPKPLSRSEFVAQCGSVPYDSVLSNASAYRGDKVRVDVEIIDIFDDGDYYARSDEDGDRSYDDLLYHLEKDAVAKDRPLYEGDIVTVYGTVEGLMTITRSATGEKFAVVNIAMLYTEPGPTPSPTPKPTPTPDPETMFEKRTFTIGKRKLTVYVVEIPPMQRGYLLEAYHEPLEYEYNRAYPYRFLGTIRDCLGVGLDYYAEIVKGKPNAVYWQPQIQIAPNNWSSGVTDNRFKWKDGEYASTEVLFWEPTDMQWLVDCPTKRISSSWEIRSHWEIREMYFASAEAARDYYYSID